MNRDYIINHLGEERDHYFGAVVPPIIQSSNFAYNNLHDLRKAFAAEYESHLYTRGNNPTVEILRKKLAALECTEDALVCGSGSSAIAAAIMSQVQQGDHIVCVVSPYAWTKILLSDYLPRFGVTTTFVDGSSTEDIAAALQDNTKVLYLESPNSLTFDCQDLKACAQLAKQHGITSIIDNSYASPIFQQPHTMGIDLVVHSGTKYLNGHSDVMMGCICGRRELLEGIFRKEYMTLGTIISPNDAALVIRGLRTLELRMHKSDQGGRIIAERLHAHPKVKTVLHPLLPSFPQYELASQQMTGAGGLFSVHFDAKDASSMEDFTHRLLKSKRFLMAVSWGGYESLVLPSVAFHGIPGREDSPIPWTMVRFYIGLEDVEWLWEGIVDAMEALA